ncbi:MAG: restriction endonuclease [Gammaproteobacteria bacterium]|nr:restriction endonuclease [Gammaproteobacteria bacterium]
MTKATTGAGFVQWMPYVLDALREQGGSAAPRDVYEIVARLAKVPDDRRFAKLGGGGLRFPNQVAWARKYLHWEGLISAPKRGLWMLTASGQSRHLAYEEARQIFLKWVAIHAQARTGSKKRSAERETVVEPPTSPEEQYKEEVLVLLQAVLSKEFERFCADLLRHIGMEHVEVTGKVGDRGIDGQGYLRVGPLVTTKVAFQCKRYTGAVGPKEIREFRGAIGTRAEKGIFFTTGYFTDSARDAAREDISKPIELVDGDRLVELLEEHEFGLRGTKTYEVDQEFIANYRRDPKHDLMGRGDR